jgi:beta-glucanase (GH16 family)
MRLKLLGLSLRSFSRLLGIGALTTVGGAPALAQYQLVWADEFNGSSLDTSKWGHQVGTGCPNLCGWGNNELQYYRPENVTVSGGRLRIAAKQESFGGMPYTSGRIWTAGLADWAYGRFEVRAKLPKGQGLWPAIWMLPTDYVYGGWAASGEIDIMELVGHEPNRVHGTLHYGEPYPNNTSSGASYALPSGDFSDAFHTFAIEWEPTEIRWFVDGVQYATQSSWWSSGGPYPAPFDQPFHLLLNVAVGGNWPGSPNGSTSFPQVMEVDWVRVYQDLGAPAGCTAWFDDMEHGDPGGNSWFVFGGANGGGSIGANAADLPPFDGGTRSLQAQFSSGGVPGYQGGFGRTERMDLGPFTHFECWVRPDAGMSGTLEINLQDDDNGDNTIPPTGGGDDDEFQAIVTVGGAGSDLVAGAGWQHLVLALDAFVDDNSYLWGGNGILDAVPVSGGGNGQLINVVVALTSATGASSSLRTDAWRFTRRSAELSGVVWHDLDGDGQRGAEPGLPGVVLELIDPIRDCVVSTATTDGSGAYALDQATEGMLRVRVVPSSLPSGAVATADPDGLALPGQATLVLACDESRSGQDFGYAVSTSLGSRFCSPAIPNSSGLSGRLDLIGSAVLAANDLQLGASQLPPNQFGMFITSSTAASVGVGAGVLCLGGQLGRFAAPGQIKNSGATGAFSLTADLTQGWPVVGVQAPAVGETWCFTAWFRDLGVTSNFTDAVALTFQ